MKINKMVILLILSSLLTPVYANECIQMELDNFVGERQETVSFYLSCRNAGFIPSEGCKNREDIYDHIEVYEAPKGWEINTDSAHLSNIQSGGNDRSSARIIEKETNKIMPRQKNTWVVFGTGKAPNA